MCVTVVTYPTLNIQYMSTSLYGGTNMAVRDLKDHKDLNFYIKLFLIIFLELLIKLSNIAKGKMFKFLLIIGMP